MKKKTIKKKSSKKFKNNSALKRAIVQMGIKQGDKAIITYDDGSTYIVECP